MPKTKRDLLYAIADSIGCTRAERLRELLGAKTRIDDLLDRPLSEAEFAAQLKQATTEWPKVIEQIEAMGEKPKSWGLPN